MWEIKVEKTTAVVYITSFQGRLLEYDRGGGHSLETGHLLKKACATWSTHFYGTMLHMRLQLNMWIEPVLGHSFLACYLL